MDDSTEGVTLYSGFLFDVLAPFEKNRETFAAPLFAMAKDLDLDEPTALVPIARYNEMCTWIEENLGQASLRRVGAAIGDRAYDQMTADGALGDNPTPAEILGELKRVASLMIQDPKGRGWEILRSEPDNILMRRTQSFNCYLQDGLLLSLVQRTGVSVPMVDQVTCVQRGDEFCEYRVRWM
ncbi:MAG: hypothetical protein ACE5GX_02760 [Thermoanaerobaculia bacterium]